MSFREKTAWVTLCAILLVSLIYFLRMPSPWEAHPQLQIVHAMGASVVAYLLIELTAWLVLRWRHPRDAREPKDERERLIDLKAIRIAYYALATGSLLAIFVTLHLAHNGPVAVGMSVFLAFVLSQVVKHAARIVYYRRGY